jgi:hypothetical protein
MTYGHYIQPPIYNWLATVFWCHEQQAQELTNAYRFAWGRFTLRLRSALVKTSREMEQYDWLWNGFFSGWGFTLWPRLLSGGELQAWMKFWHGCQYENTFGSGSSPEIKFLEQPQTFGKEIWPLENSNSRLLFILFYSYHPQRGVHLHLLYVYTCENPLFNGGYLPSFVEYFLPYK